MQLGDRCQTQRYTSYNTVNDHTFYNKHFMTFFVSNCKSCDDAKGPLA